MSGFQFVTQIENQKVDTKSHPYADIRINNSGELVLRSKGIYRKLTIIGDFKVAQKSGQSPCTIVQ